MMILNELFYSLQGEGGLAGVPSVFIRLAGCPLRCRWCDTKYAWEATAGTELSAEEIAERIREYPTRYVVITGGEPLLHPDLAVLTCLLRQQDYHITIETAGIHFLPDLACDLISISPKLKNSAPVSPDAATDHETKRFDVISLRRLIESYPYQLKFVIDQPDDCDEIAECLEQIATIDPYRIYLMPQAVNLEQYLEKSRWLAEYCLRTGFSFSPRLQVMLWEGRKGK